MRERTAKPFPMTSKAQGACVAVQAAQGAARPWGSGGGTPHAGERFKRGPEARGEASPWGAPPLAVGVGKPLGARRRAEGHAGVGGPVRPPLGGWLSIPAPIFGSGPKAHSRRYKKENPGNPHGC